MGTFPGKKVRWAMEDMARVHGARSGPGTGRLAGNSLALAEGLG